MRNERPDPGELLGQHPAGGTIRYLSKTLTVVHEHPLSEGKKEARRDVLVHFGLCDQRLCRALAAYVVRAESLFVEQDLLGKPDLTEVEKEKLLAAKRILAEHEGPTTAMVRALLGSTEVS